MKCRRDDALRDVIVIEPRVFEDRRGFFFESYHLERYEKAGIDLAFVQDNHSRSAQNTLRGLHAQREHPQGKLVRVLMGTIFDVAVDIRRSSPTFLRWAGWELSAENRRQVYVPPGFAHGFCVLSECAEVEYKCTDYYRPEDEIVIRWDDPAIGIAWPIAHPILSDKDREAPAFSDLSADSTTSW